MATSVQRVQAICDAVVNGFATPAQIDRLGVAIAATVNNTAYATMTGGQKADFIVQHVRQYLVGIQSGVCSAFGPRNPLDVSA